MVILSAGADPFRFNSMVNSALAKFTQCIVGAPTLQKFLTNHGMSWVGLEENSSFLAIMLLESVSKSLEEDLS